MNDDISQPTPVAPQGTDGQGLPKRAAIFGALVVLLALVGVLYFFNARARAGDDLLDREARALQAMQEFERTQPTATPRPRAEPTPVPEGLGPAPGEVLVVNRVPGDDYGRLAIRHADGTRTLLDRRCQRMHIAADRGVCTSLNDTIVPSYTTSFFPSNNPDFELKSYGSALPSRARITPDGATSSVTAFVTGTSYADVGTGETTTIVTFDDIDGNLRLRGANQFEVEADDDRYQVFDVQYWGTTFAPDSDELYITGYYSDYPEIMHGRLSDLTVRPTGWIGSCPSLSPDGKTLIYKEMRNDGGFDLVAVDLASDERWTVSETRSVDDQVEWLDNDTILYALHPEGREDLLQPEFDIWMVDIAPGSAPQLFLPNADSPAVAR